MRLLFTGTTPFWLVILVLCIASIYTLLIYRRHRLPKPWSVWLPVLRIAAMVMLVMTLLQPVLSIESEHITRAAIPIVVDNSGSMSISDLADDALLVKMASRLRLFPKERRTGVFEKVQRDLRDKVRPLEIDPEKETKELDLELTRVAGVLDALAKQLPEQKREVGRGVGYQGYLKADASKVRSGKLKYERFDGIPGLKVEDLAKHPSFPGKPSRVSELDSFQVPRNRGDNFGGKISGYLFPPQTGEYVFMICSDDEGQLYLSQDLDPGHKKLIARLERATTPFDFDKSPEQKSRKIRLERDRPYYMEALLKEGTGDDFVCVGWIKPDGKQENVIPGKYLLAADKLPLTALFQYQYSRFGTLVDKVLADIRSWQNVYTKDKGQGASLERNKQLLELLGTAKVDLGEILSQLDQLQVTADRCLASAYPEEFAKVKEQLGGMSRFDLVYRMLYGEDASLLQTLDKVGDVDVYMLNEPVTSPLATVESEAPPKADLNSTRIGSVVSEVLATYVHKPVAAVLLFSDGRNNAGKSFPEVKQLLKERDVPLHALGFGQMQPPKDISIESVEAPTTSFKDDSVDIHVSIRRHGYESVPMTLEVYNGDKVIHTEQIPPGGLSSIGVDISFKEEQSGLQHYRVAAVPQQGEVLDSNNAKTFSVNIITDPVKALLIDEFPRWESRYLNMMLKRDQRVEVNTIFVGSMANGQLVFGEQKSNCYPATRDELFAYDVIVLGDVNPKHFGDSRLRDLRDFVVERGGTLILMAGDNYMPELYRETVLGQVFPFRVQPESVLKRARDSQGRGDGKVSMRLQLAGGVRYENLVQIGSNPDSTAELWSGLPGVNWVKEGIHVMPQAEEMVKTVKSQSPVMLTGYAGLGKILYLGADSFWNWRYRVRWRYHHRLWGQIMLWAIQGRTSGNDRFVKLLTERPQYSPGETVLLKARVLDRDGKALEGAEVSAQIKDEDGRLVRNVRFIGLPNSGGEYRAQVKDLPKGKYVVTPYVEELRNEQVTAEYTFEIKDLPTSEYVELSSDTAALKAFSNSYRFFLDAEELVDVIEKRELKEIKRRDWELWDSWGWLVIVTILLGVEWQLRKKVKLV